MKKQFFCIALLASALTLYADTAKFTGYHDKHCHVLPAEDIDVLSRHIDIIGVLKDPSIKPSSEEKYLAAKKLVENVDMTFVRETKTLDQLLYYGDAIIDEQGDSRRIITFFYEWKGHFVKMVFRAQKQFVVRGDVYLQ